MPDKDSPTFPTLTTVRLNLRQLLESDVEEIFLLRSDKTVNQFLNRKPAETQEDALNFIKHIRKNEVLYWAITETQTGKLAGTICIFDVSDSLHTCEIGYELLPDYQGQGIMEEASKAVVEFANNKLGIQTIDAFTHKDNQGSTRLLQKLNFNKTEIVDETNPDLLVYRLSKEA